MMMKSQFEVFHLWLPLKQIDWSDTVPKLVSMFSEIASKLRQ
jgi:hypothetical protein